MTTAQRRSLRVGKVDASKVSTKDKKVNVAKMVAEQRAWLAKSTELMGDARSRKDIVQLNCVNAKRVQLKGLLKLSQQADNAMQEALATGTQDDANHEYTKVAVAHQRSQSLSSEAEQCVGEQSIYSGQTDVEVEIDDSITQQDPTLPILPPPGPVVAAPASDF